MDAVNKKKTSGGKLNTPAKIIGLLAIVLCACTDVPEHCGDKFPSLNPATQFCHEGQPVPKCGGETYNPDKQICNENNEVKSNINQLTINITTNDIANDATGGTVTYSPKKSEYAYGDTVLLTARPTDNYNFVGWNGATTEANDTVKIVIIVGDTTLTAVFKENGYVTPPPKYTLNISMNPTDGGTVVVNVNSEGDAEYQEPITITKDSGTTISISAVANDNYKFYLWAVSGVYLSAENLQKESITIVLSTDITIEAEFIDTSDGGGDGRQKYLLIVMVDYDTVLSRDSVEAGKPVNISAGTPPAEKQFKVWRTESHDVTFKDSGTSETFFTMPDHDVTVTAVFEPITYRVEMAFAGTNASTAVARGDTVGVESAGAGASGTGDYAAGDSVTINAGTPPTGWKFTQWTGDVSFVNKDSAVTTFTMPSNAVTVKAVFESEYEWVLIGSQRWMKKNLDIYKDNSWCYKDSPDSCNKYGRLYTRDAAWGICPTGWHLPSREEWNTLANTAGGTNVAGKNLKSKSEWLYNGNDDDTYGFSALPGGYRKNNSFIYVGEIGAWWTSTWYFDDKLQKELAYVKYINYNSDKLEEDTYQTTIDGMSVRCVMDEQ